jgi:hypothetical protein
MPASPAATGSAPVILCVGEDADLLDTRTLLLQSIGAEVHCCAAWRILQAAQPESGDEALLSMDNIRFDLIVLCHTIEPAAARKIARMARRRLPSCRTLLLQPISVAGNDRTLPGFDAVACVEPASLLSSIACLLVRQSASTDEVSVPARPAR